MSRLEIRLQRLLNTTPDAAFKHWVDADARRRWYAPQDGWIVEAETDLRVGGAWRVLFGPSRHQMYLEHGVFEEVDPPHRLVYTTLYEFPDGRHPFETHVTVTFEARDGGTLLTVLDTGYPSEEQRASHESGWPGFLDAFERTLASKTGSENGEQMGLSSYRVSASIAVSDMTKAEAFYEGQLGLAGVADQIDGSHRYACGDGTSLHVYLSPANAGKATGTLATWYVPDLEHVVDELSANGVTFERYDDPQLQTDARGIHSLGAGGVAWFKDPDGNTFAVEE